ncbi:MAG: FeoB-associated Cys-rich membrane protein [Muribaculaceae bacterium]|nr:FeoB-associated Cys-rich membrane protein [Muribaculaceae bacterium]
MSDTIQWIIVGIIVVLAIIYIYRRVKSNNNCDSGCDNCPLSEKCTKK